MNLPIDLSKWPGTAPYSKVLLKPSRSGMSGMALSGLKEFY